MSSVLKISRLLWGVIGLALCGSLASCQKTDKLSASGGGSSTQSVMSIRGAAR